MKLLLYPDPRLSLVSEPADPAKSQALIGKMRAVMLRGQGIGLAAPQLGVLRRIIVIAPSPREFRAFVNPRIVEASTLKVESIEGCLSFPGRRLAVNRHAVIRIEHDTIGGVAKETFEGRVARIIQHEIDHLDGVLIGGRA